MTIAVKTTVALVASLAVNVAAFGGLDWSAHQAQIAPAGTVLVAQLPDETGLVAYAETAQGAARAVASL